FDERRRPSFAALQRRMHVASPAQRLVKSTPVTYVVFDLLWLDGHALMGLTYAERRKQLAGLRLSGPSWQTPEHVVGHGKALREDKDPREVVREDAAAEREAQPRPALVISGEDAKKATTTVEGRELRLSNLDKPMYPRAGFAKRDVIDYYAAIGPALLAHL